MTAAATAPLTKKGRPEGRPFGSAKRARSALAITVVLKAATLVVQFAIRGALSGGKLLLLRRVARVLGAVLAPVPDIASRCLNVERHGFSFLSGRRASYSPSEPKRFLTPAQEEVALDRLTRERNDPSYLRTAHPEAKGGTGWLDPEILPLLDTLNAIEGVCTFQSCCGHDGLGPDGTGHMFGQVWLRLSERMTAIFEARVGELLAHDVIWHVSKLYSYKGGDQPEEVVDIQFHGAYVGRMDEAKDVIGSFFERCRREAS